MAKKTNKEKVAKLEQSLGSVQHKRLHLEAQLNALNNQHKALTEQMVKIANEITEANKSKTEG